MKHLIVDAETTGLPIYSLPADDDDQHRMIQLGALLVDVDVNPDKFVVLEEMEMIIQPTQSWPGMEQAALEVHGITYERAALEGVPVAEAIEAFNAMDDRADVITGFNLRFDLKYIRGDRRRLGQPDRFGRLPQLDLMHASRPHCNVTDVRGKRKAPNLDEAYLALVGKAREAGHSALVDCYHCNEILRALFELGESIGGKLPKSTKSGRDDAPQRPAAPAEGEEPEII